MSDSPIIHDGKITATFECPKCKERYVPAMKKYVMVYRTITRRKLKCPECYGRGGIGGVGIFHVCYGEGEIDCSNCRGNGETVEEDDEF